MVERSAESQTLVIIGNGMVSWKLCQRLVERGVHEQIRIVVFGEETRPAYDRVHLTNLLSGGEEEESLILAPQDWYEENGIELHLGDPVVEVDRARSRVVPRSGEPVEYNRLVFATGSYPFVPNIEGVDLRGVFLYREIDDVYAIEDFAHRAARAVVIGGGLLGLEAAKALFDLGLPVHVIEHGPGLLHRQIDMKGADLLRKKIEDIGVKVMVKKDVARITSSGPVDPDDPTGAERLTLHFADGEKMHANMVLISAGIRPRGELAQAAGLLCAPNGGIMVDDHLQTSDEQIYAIGECAAHRGTSYGLVLPGYQMADVVVDNLLGGKATFEGGDRSATLKVMGVTVAALGEYDGESKALTSALRYPATPDPNIQVYRKLVTRNGRLIGVVTVGEWDNLDRIRDALRAPVPMGFWDMRRFRATGNLWPKDESLKVSDWAPTALVCGCMQVTRGTLSQAIAEGCNNMATLGRKTSAGTMCGSCKPLMEELLGVAEPPKLPVSMSMSFGPVTVLDAGAAARKSSAPRSQRSAELAARAVSSLPPPSVRGAPQLPPPSVRGAPQVPPPSVRGGNGPTSVRGGSGPASVRSKDLRGLPSLGTLGKVVPTARGSQPGTKRGKRSLPVAEGAPRTPHGVLPPPPPALNFDDAPTATPPSGMPAMRRSQPPPSTAPTTRRVSTPPPARISTPPPAMLFSSAAVDEVEEEAPVSLRRPAVGPQSRRMTRSRRADFVDTPPEGTEIPAMPVIKRPPPSSIPPALPIAVDPTLIDLAEEALAALAAHDKITHFALPELEKLAATSKPPAALEESEDVEIEALKPAPLPEIEPPSSNEDEPTSSQRYDEENDNLYMDEEELYRRGEEEDEDEEEEDEEYDEEGEYDGLGVAMPDRAVSAARRSWVPPQARTSQPPPAPIAGQARHSRPPMQSGERGLMALFVASLCGLVLSAGILAGAILYERILPHRSRVAMLGDNLLLKQITGYALVGLAVVSLGISLRKRWRRFTVSEVPIWRMIHGLVGASTLLVLAAHTGLQLGKPMELLFKVSWARLVVLLSLDFLLVTALGAVAGVITAVSPMWSPVAARDRRARASRIHFFVCLPLPVLVILHVLQVYYY